MSLQIVTNSDLMPATFNYSILDLETETFVRETTDQLKDLMGRVRDDVITIGKKLKEVKEKLPHGQFGGWLEREFAWSQDKAEKLMRVADTFGEIPQFAELDIDDSALYVLAARSTPVEARQEVLERAQNGEHISHKKTKEAIKWHAPEKKQPTKTVLKPSVRKQYVACLHELVNVLGKAVALDPEELAAKIEPDEAEWVAGRLAEGSIWLEKVTWALGKRDSAEPSTPASP
jgi:hypothetical protein